MSNANENKDAIIRQQKLIIADQLDTIAKQHLELARLRELNYYTEREPWRYCLWLMFRHIWPFSLLWNR